MTDEIKIFIADDHPIFSTTVSQALDEVRQIAANPHPYQLDHLGLTKALTELFISHRMVENHRANIGQKLNLKGGHSLLKFAFDHKSAL